jgi:hypothetical protein
MGLEQPRVTMPAMEDLKKDVLNVLLDPQKGLPYAARAVIRSRVGLGPETTNSVPFAVSTNTAPAVSATNRPGK